MGKLRLSRRQFLTATALAWGGAILAACNSPQYPPVIPTRVPLTATSKPAPASPTPTKEPQASPEPTQELFPFFVQEGRVFDTQTGNQVEYVGILPEEIKIERVQEARLINDKGVESGKILLGYDIQGRLMIIRPDGQSWMVAPFGKALVDGVWKVFEDQGNGSMRQLGVVEANSKMGATAELQAIAQIFDKELSNSTPGGEFGPYYDGDYQLRVPDNLKSDIYMKILESWAISVSNQTFWREVGFNGSSSSELDDWLSQSVGGPDSKNYWLPSKSKNGTEFNIPQTADGFRTVVMRPWKAIQDDGGIYVDCVSYLTISPSEMKEDLWLKAWFDYHSRLNGGRPAPYIWYAGSTDGKTLFTAEMWGFFPVSSDRIVFVIADPVAWPYFEWEHFGDSSGNRSDKDPIVATAKLQSYLEITKSNNGIDKKQVCLAESTNCTIPQLIVDSEEITNLWFVLSQ